jgi:hypothetical protein
MDADFSSTVARQHDDTIPALEIAITAEAAAFSYYGSN